MKNKFNPASKKRGAKRPTKEVARKLGLDLLDEIYTNNPTLENVQKLILAGADLTVKDQRGGRTALHMAAFYGYEDLLIPLLEAGANIEARDDEKKTPILSAAAGHEPGCVRILLKAGADHKAKDVDGDDLAALCPGGFIDELKKFIADKKRQEEKFIRDGMPLKNNIQKVKPPRFKKPGKK